MGHAIEKVSNFNSYLHGEAVSIGMMVAANISMRKGLIAREVVNQQENNRLNIKSIEASNHIISP